jgi:hypothetical protein
VWCDPAYHEDDGSCRSTPVVVRDESVFALLIAVQLYQAAHSDRPYLGLTYTAPSGYSGGFAIAARSAAELGNVMRHVALGAVTT